VENPCKIICFGDSITTGYYPYFKTFIQDSMGDVDFEILNFGVNGEKSCDGYMRLKKVVDEKPDVVILGFGMNDYLKGNNPENFYYSIEKIIEKLDQKKIRVILNTLNPICYSNGMTEDLRLLIYNDYIKELAEKYSLVVNDVYSDWKREFQLLQVGLVYENCDFVHPNHIGYELIAKRLSQIVPRSITRIVWQFNGADAECNYKCPYCYQPSDFHTGQHFMFDTKIWRESYKTTFRNRRLNFYLSFGEPLVAKNINEILNMIEFESRWKVVILTNLSQDIQPFLKSNLVEDGRLFIVASFHPTMTNISKFVQKILIARHYNIEIPVVYVMWPPQIEKFEKIYFPVFQKHGILVHIRRFRGEFKGQQFPEAYSWDQIKSIAKYMDDLSIKYMLCDRLTSGKESFAGMSYLGVSNNGDLWVCPDWSGEHLGMGNIVDGTGHPNISPMILGGHFSDGTTDGIANLLETEMNELDDNHIITYAEQTGFELNGTYISYPNFRTNFDYPAVQERLGLYAIREFSSD
jgi:acyl-CoA thioesterase I